jgi:hypothetical protein
MWWMLLGVGWAGKWDGVVADVELKQVVPLPREEIQRTLGDWASWQRLLPCATEWELQERTTGVGARARALYLIGPMRQRLVGVIRKDEPGLVLELETEGKRGWITQVTFADAPEGSTEVRLLTPLLPPKWPLKGVFYKEVRPAWQRCYADLLTSLARK